MPTTQWCQAEMTALAAGAFDLSGEMLVISHSAAWPYLWLEGPSICVWPGLPEGYSQCVVTISELIGVNFLGRLTLGAPSVPYTCLVK